MKSLLLCALILLNAEIAFSQDTPQNLWAKSVINGTVDVYGDLPSGVDVNAPVDKDGNTALHVAVHRNNIVLVQYLITNKGNIDIENNYKETPRKWAYKNTLYIAEYLGDPTKKTPIHSSSERYYTTDERMMENLHWDMLNYHSNQLKRWENRPWDPKEGF